MNKRKPIEFEIDSPGCLVPWNEAFEKAKDRIANEWKENPTYFYLIHKSTCGLFDYDNSLLYTHFFVLKTTRD